jgi:AcrR family transcriptional regulator
MERFARQGGNTRQLILEAALEVFAEQGYEKASLRMIAERLGVTKAALYYHFSTKEEIVLSLLESVVEPIERLIKWGRDQPSSLESRQHIACRYSEIVSDAEPLILFMEQSRAAMRELQTGVQFEALMAGMQEILCDPDSGDNLMARARSFAVVTLLNSSELFGERIEGAPESKREAILDVALDLLAGTGELTSGVGPSGPRAWVGGSVNDPA